MASLYARYCSSALGFACVLAIGCSDVTSHNWPQRTDPETGIALRLRPETQTIKAGQSPHFTALLVNGGEKEVILVEPGDGSDFGWRTPIVEWSRRHRHCRRLCGNINAMKSDEVFTLAPGASRQLNGWIGEPYLSGSGRYKVALRYINEPQRGWSGVPLGSNEPGTWEAIRGSIAVSVVSNMVEVIVE